MDALIPFNKPCATGHELAYVTDAIASGHLSGDGTYTARCHAWLERALGVRRALLTTSCTHALEMAALLLRLQAGDEVIVPAYTFVSVVNAVVLRGARPVFADVRADTLNLDETRLESLITPRTRAIIVVHYAGVACEMDSILGIAVIEDNAHGLFGRYKGRLLGTIGALATLSFHETKNVTCGEGGALLINDPSLVERAEIIREKGTNRASFFRGQVNKYTWVDEGSSYLPSDMLAAFLLAQLESSDRIQADRQRAWDHYADHLSEWARRQNVRLPGVPAGCEQPCHTFYMVMPALADREALIEHLRARGIASAFHYLPLHLSDMGRRFGGTEGDCPVTEDLSDRLVRLPLYRELTGADLARIVTAVTAWPAP